MSTNEEKDFMSSFDKVYEEKAPDFSKTINIAVVGKVSSGKSSLINAIMERDRSNPIAKVGATSGVTTTVKAFRLDDNVLIMDSPGLDDIVKENSQETINFLKHIDVGILVVTGSLDVTQKKHYEDLTAHAKKVILVLNKVDEWDDLEDSELYNVTHQWKTQLKADKLFPVCTKGYDPKTRKDAPMDLRGIVDLQNEIWGFLRTEGKDILLARHLGNKKNYAAGIIATALAAVAAEAFIPGSAAYITATQVVAITSLYYLYTGKILEKGAALALIPTFAAQSIGSNLFLWVKSFLPPTGVVDIAAAGVAVSVTLAMLGAVNFILANGYELDQKGILKEKFDEYRTKDLGKDILTVIRSGSGIKELIIKLLQQK